MTSMDNQQETRKELNLKQKELIVGLLLGNSKISINNKDEYFFICKLKNINFINLVKNILKDFVKTEIKQDPVQNEFFTFCTIPNYFFSDLMKLFYNKDKKIIPFDIIKNINESIFSIWFYDIGEHTKTPHKSHFHNNHFLYTNFYTLEENKLIRKYLFNNFDIKTSVLMKRYDAKRKYYILYFAIQTKNKLLEILKKYLPEKSLNQKLGSSETLCEPSIYWNEDKVPSV